MPSCLDCIFFFFRSTWHNNERTAKKLSFGCRLSCRPHTRTGDARWLVFDDFHNKKTPPGKIGPNVFSPKKPREKLESVMIGCFIAPEQGGLDCQVNSSKHKITSDRTQRDNSRSVMMPSAARRAQSLVRAKHKFHSGLLILSGTLVSLLQCQRLLNTHDSGLKVQNIHTGGKKTNGYIETQPKLHHIPYTYIYIYTDKHVRIGTKQMVNSCQT